MHDVWMYDVEFMLMEHWPETDDGVSIRFEGISNRK